MLVRTDNIIRYKYETRSCTAESADDHDCEAPEPRSNRGSKDTYTLPPARDDERMSFDVDSGRSHGNGMPSRRQRIVHWKYRQGVPYLISIPCRVARCQSAGPGR